MYIRRFASVFVVLAGEAAGLVSINALEAAPPATAVVPEANTVRGKIETAGNKKITVIDDQQDRQTFDVDSGAKITLDGKNVKLDELTAGASVTVMTKKGNDSLAVMITAESPE